MKPKCVVVKKKQMDAALRRAPRQGKHGLEPFASFALKNKLPFSVLEDSKVSNEPEIHRTEDDVWFCLQGSATFIYGGKLKNSKPRKKPDGTANPNEICGTVIIGGTKATLKPGDWLWIPARVPHQHSAQDTARLVIIKIPAKK